MSVVSSVVCISSFVSTYFKGEFEVKEMYRALAITAAHFHMMIRKTLINKATTERCDAMETAFYLQNIRT